MNRFLFIVFAALISVNMPMAYSQKKAAFTDRAQFLNERVESALAGRLRADSVELTSLIDTRKRCDYWFSDLSVENGNLLLSVTDCNDAVAGKKDLGSTILTASDEEKALLLYYALSDIIRNPGKNAIPPVKAKEYTVNSEPEPASIVAADPGQHRSRYFFAPSAYNLEKGELYYNSLYFFVHDAQYGISDKFSLGMGTTIAGFPFYLTPKLTVPLKGKSSLAVGDLMMVGTWGTKFFGNLLYTTFTAGGYNNNISIGGGWLNTSDNDKTAPTNTIVFNLSGLLQVSSHIYFITENYVSSVNTIQEANYSYYDPVTYYSDYRNVKFDLNCFFVFGLTGFRFINKEKDVKSWQFGLAYMFTSFEDIPMTYKGQYWNHYGGEGSRFVAIPAIGFARKFGLRY